MLDTVQHFITSDKDVGVGSIPFNAVLFTINHICVVNWQNRRAKITG